MTTTTFTDLITDESQLRDVFGWPSARAVNKQIDHLDQHCRAIVPKALPPAGHVRYHRAL